VAGLKNSRDAGVGQFERICAEIEAPLYSYALRLSGNRSEAEDIAQESLLRLFGALQQGKLNGSPRAYAFSIAHNLAMDLHRRKPPAPPDPAPVALPSQDTERHLLREQLERALKELPENQRAALLLREFGGLRYAEIAETLGVSVGQVKIWIYRGRKKLADLLDRDGQYIGTQNHVS